MLLPFSILSILIVFLHTFLLVKSEWAKVTVPSSNYNFRAVTWPYAGTVLACGQGDSGVILRSTNFGVTWTIAYTAIYPLFGLSSKTITPNSVTYYMVVDSQRSIYWSIGTGESWSVVGERPDFSVYSTAIGSNGNAFVVGEDTVLQSAYDTLFSTWTTLSTGADFTVWFDVSTPDGVNVIIVGTEGSIYYSSNSGSTWSAGSSETTDTIYCVSHAGSSTSFAMAAGEKGYIAKTANGGSTWSTMTVFSTDYIARFRSVSLLSESEAYVAAYPQDGITSAGLIYRTLNGGSSWTIIASVNAQLYSLSMYSSSYGVAGSASGTGIFALVPGKLLELFGAICILLYCIVVYC
jgi:photosystem II stability/assembly factor-like uncharacterized protein